MQFYLPYCSFCDPAPTTPDSHYVVYNMWMTGIMLPLIGVCGLVRHCHFTAALFRPPRRTRGKNTCGTWQVGNSISVFVFSRAKMRSKSCHLYLCVLAMADMVVIATGMFLFTIEGACRPYAQLRDRKLLFCLNV